MNTSIHIPDDLSRRLSRYISSSSCQDKSRNAFIIKAIEQRLNELESEENWSKEILNWQGGDVPLTREDFTGFGTKLEL
jgi:predicted transcriptional regulator